MMKSVIILLVICAAFFIAPSTQLSCINDDPCNITTSTYFVPQNGYTCRQQGPSAFCTCPNGDYEIDEPCRLCARRDYRRNACNVNATNYVFCVESKDYQTSYACLCNDAAGQVHATTNWNCDLSVTVVSTSTTTAAAIQTACFNGGVYFNGGCNCPSGFEGQFCERRNEPNQCERIVCKNGGVCVIRDTVKPYGSVCACRNSYFGEYCEIQGTAGFCSASACNNGGACQESIIGSSRFAYCVCPAGYNGVKCDNRYFTCPSAGNHADAEMFTQGKYFECTSVNGALVARTRSCPKGLRFNLNRNLCTL